MTTMNDLFPSPYLTAQDVEHKPIVSIKSLAKKTMKSRDGEDEVKPVLYFNEFEKGMVLNKTNADIVAGFYGGVIEEWVGERIQLQSVVVEAFGKRQPAIRVAENRPGYDKQTLIERFSKLYERALKAKVDGLENYVVSPSMSEQEIIDLGKELKVKVEGAEQF